MKQRFRCKRKTILLVMILGPVFFIASACFMFANRPHPGNPLPGGSEDLSWVGDRVFLGSCEQDADPSDGEEPVLWRVLQYKNGRMLLLSEYGLDVRPFHPRFEDVSWETSEVRSWMNTDFAAALFKDRGAWKEEYLLPVRCESASNSYYGTDGGAATDDRVFLFSTEDTFNEAYGFPGPCRIYSGFTGRDVLYSEVCLARVCYPTLYASLKSALITRKHDFREDPNGKLIDGFGSVYWILRNPGMTPGYITYVSRWGRTTCDFPSPVDHDESCIRPAVWVDTKKLPFKKLGDGTYCVREDGDYVDECRRAVDYGAAIQYELKHEETRPASGLTGRNMASSLGSAATLLGNPVPGGTPEGEWEGDRVYFGHFQDEPILWRVLHVDDNRLLLLSEYGLTKHRYASSKNRTALWSESEARRWLNDTLFYELFSKSEQAAVVVSTIQNPPNPRYGTGGEGPTKDRLFYLSYEESMNEDYGFSGGEYPCESNTRICGAFGKRAKTEKKMYGKRDISGNPIWCDLSASAIWTLRTTGFTDEYVCDVTRAGDVYHHEQRPKNYKFYVRPALVVDTDLVEVIADEALPFPVLRTGA